MASSLIIEILLGLVAVMIGLGSFIGANRVEKLKANVSIADIDADAYERAKGIYESAIKALEGHVVRLREQMDILDVEVRKLQSSNRDLYLNNVELTTQVAEMRAANARLTIELHQLRDTRNGQSENPV